MSNWLWILTQSISGFEDSILLQFCAKGIKSSVTEVSGLHRIRQTLNKCLELNFLRKIGLKSIGSIYIFLCIIIFCYFVGDRKYVNLAEWKGMQMDDV